MDKNDTMEKHGLGYYQCFCDEFQSKKYFKNFCKEHSESQNRYNYFTVLVSVVIVYFNNIIRMVNIAIINRIGYDKKS